jgi:hypothetical protein
MTPAAWIAICFGLSSLVLNLVALAVGYGVLKGTVGAQDKRIKALEAEIGAVTELKVAMGEVKTSVGFLLEQLKDLNASIRWMREPAQYSPNIGGQK